MCIWKNFNSIWYVRIYENILKIWIVLLRLTFTKKKNLEYTNLIPYMKGFGAMWHVGIS